MDRRNQRFITNWNPAVDNREAILQARLQSDRGEKTRDNNPMKGIDFSLLLLNVQAYQAKLLKVTQGELQFAFDFGPQGDVADLANILSETKQVRQHQCRS